MGPLDYIYNGYGFNINMDPYLSSQYGISVGPRQWVFPCVFMKTSDQHIEY